MSGHNKWSQIKRQKGKTDAQKSAVFGKFSRLITEEAKKAKGNRESPSLKVAIERAKAINMPNDSIDRAVKKATTDKSAMLENVTYEAYGPGGSALIIEGLTGNRNKAAQEVKHILSNHGFELAVPGSASWAFKKTHEGWEPQTTIPLGEVDLALLETIMNELEANDEVQEVFSNAE